MGRIQVLTGKAEISVTQPRCLRVGRVAGVARAPRQGMGLSRVSLNDHDLSNHGIVIFHDVILAEEYIAYAGDEGE